MHEREQTIPATYQRTRNPHYLAITRIQGAALKGARDYFHSQEWTEIPVPHLTRATGACENITTMYEVPHNGKAFLSQTGQLFLESMLQPGMHGNWTIGPSFRKETEDDGRHQSEFTLIEFEHHGDFEELLSHIEGTISCMVNSVLKNTYQDLETLSVHTSLLENLQKPFIRISYAQVVERYSDKLCWGDDIPSAIEQDLVHTYAFGQPLFITHYPEEIKFFNMRNNPDDPRVVNSADLIVPWGGECAGSAERIIDPVMLRTRLEKSAMMQQLRARGVESDAFQWYIDCVEKNKPELHSGCGIGLGRVMQYIIGAKDIRKTTPFPVSPLYLD